MNPNLTTEKKALIEITLVVSHLIILKEMRLSESDRYKVDIALDLLAEALIENGYIGYQGDEPIFKN